MNYNFDKKIQIGKFEVGIDTEHEYGFVEHDDEGEMGGLWFNGDTLVDYDGSYYDLPKEVKQAITQLGYKIEEC